MPEPTLAGSGGGLFEFARSLVRHRYLIGQLTRREVTGRYRGSVLGLAWSFFNPLLMLAVYTFLFGTVFKMRWGVDTGASASGYALTLFAGLIVHAMIAECLNRAPGLIVANPSYVKRVVFPLEVMAWVTVLSALFHAGTSTLLLVAGLLLAEGRLPPTLVWVPVVLVPVVLLCVGIVWWLSAAGVYLRDLAQATGILATVSLFLAPVLYPISMIPEQFRPWIRLNPVTFPVEQFRRVVIEGLHPDLVGLAAYTAIALLFALAGLWWFDRARKGFADVL